ncbi:hypothetical protein GXB78_06125 [Pseudomonas moraviensis subsp. stanleyae]|uniref:hypothetical protein n=1 Tax=Pseudomonas moraviensis TaxID=321662 RepID=UPI002E2FE973|nr:hypothetical protein [Pseudomonas moraviensis]MED7666782.1 hypothetical protein [Pseudomonas moraviensis subsp. stanleyae]
MPLESFASDSTAAKRFSAASIESSSLPVSKPSLALGFVFFSAHLEGALQSAFLVRFLALVHKKYPDIQRVTEFNLQPVIEKTLLEVVNLSNIRPAFTTTVYAFLNPKLPSAAWDFFCLRFGVWAPFPPSPPSEAPFFRLLLTGRFPALYKGVRRC